MRVNFRTARHEFEENKRNYNEFTIALYGLNIAGWLPGTAIVQQGSITNERPAFHIFTKFFLLLIFANHCLPKIRYANTTDLLRVFDFIKKEFFNNQLSLVGYFCSYAAICFIIDDLIIPLLNHPGSNRN